ncbi:MAG: ABC transporter permease [Theionarchaea archaeon]|nr:ABC transporter permease [Theionarchaea archaeon]
MSMLGFITKRVVALVVIIFVLITMVFVLFRVMPSDPAAMVVVPRMTPELKEILGERFGLDEPMWVQYFIYLRNLLRGDMGTSFYWQGDVFDIVMSRLLPTAILTGVALIIAVIIDFVAEGALNKKSPVVNTLFFLIPFLFLGLLAIFVFAYKMDLFPVGGMKSPEVWSSGLRASLGAKIADIAYHLILPLHIMVIWLFVGFVPLVKTLSRGVIQEKKALLPAGLTTVAAASVIFLGAVVTETTFSWPGFHSAFVEASLNYDYPLAQGAMIAGVVFSLVVALLIEVFYVGLASRAKS